MTASQSETTFSMKLAHRSDGTIVATCGTDLLLFSGRSFIATDSSREIATVCQAATVSMPDLGHGSNRVDPDEFVV
jgi:hypothetical protein